MSMDLVKGSKEFLLVAERMANEKGIPLESIITAMEEGIRLAARKKYGTELEVECKIDRKTGAIAILNNLEIVEDELEESEDFDPKLDVTLTEATRIAKKNNIDIEQIVVGNNLSIELPPVDLSRVIVQIAKTEIIKRVKEAEKLKEFDEFKDRIGTIVYGLVKKDAARNLIVEVDGYETLLHKENLIPGEKFRVGDRIKAYIVDVSQERKDAQVLLSRTDNNFLIELFKQEVTEIYDGLIEIRAVARDPGSKAKVVVYSKDNFSDVIGICVGPRGAKVQAVSAELKGEKIDIVKWSEDIGELVSNVLATAKINKVIVDEESNIIEVVIPDDQLSLAIGRGGQNIKLTAKIMGAKIDILTEEEEKTKRLNEFNDVTKLFVRELDVEEIIAQLLATEGYSSVEELAETKISDLIKIEGFDEDIAEEISNRAKEALENSINIEE